MRESKNSKIALEKEKNKEKKASNLTRELRMQFLDLYKSFLDIFQEERIENLVHDIRDYVFMGDWIEDVFLTFVQYAINTFYDMHTPGYYDKSIEGLLKGGMYKEYILLACSEIETIMYIDAKKLCDTEEFQAQNKEKYETWNTKMKTSRTTLNDYIEFTYNLDKLEHRFVEHFYKIDFLVMRHVFSTEGLNIRNFYSHGNNKGSAEMKIDAFIVMGIIANMIGLEYVEQYLDDRYTAP